MGEAGKGDKEAQNLKYNINPSQKWKNSVESVVNNIVTSFCVEGGDYLSGVSI